MRKKIDNNGPAQVPDPTGIYARCIDAARKCAIEGTDLYDAMEQALLQLEGTMLASEFAGVCETVYDLVLSVRKCADIGDLDAVQVLARARELCAVGLDRFDFDALDPNQEVTS